MPLYLSGELDAKAMSDFELHLEQCVVCRRELKQQRTYDDLLRDVIVGESLDVRELRAAVLNRITTPGRAGLFFGRLAYLRAIAAVVLVAFVMAIVYLALRPKHVATLYADAVDDHYEEVVQRAPLPGWRETRADINTLGQKQLGESEIFNKLGPTGYQLVRARVCELGGELYVHAEYKNEKGEISIFLKRRGADLPRGTSDLPGLTKDLPGLANEVVKGCPIHVASTRGFQIAGFQSEQFTVLIVSNLSWVENVRLARESAARLA